MFSPSKFQNPCVNRRDYYDDHSEKNDAWYNFCHEIKCVNRFFPEKPFDDDFFKRSIKHCIKKLTTEDIFYRSRVDKKEYFHLEKDLTAPPAEKSKHFRANPKNISYLYLASDEETVIQETYDVNCPFRTLVKFQLQKDINVIDNTSFFCN